VQICVGLARTVYMHRIFGDSLAQNTVYIHRIYMVLANPKYVFSRPSLNVSAMQLNIYITKKQ